MANNDAPTHITYNPVYQVTYERADPARGYVYVRKDTRPAPAATDGGFANFCRFNVETYLLDTWLHMHHDREPVSDEQVIEEARHSIIQGRISLLKRHIERMEVILRAKEANHV